MRNVIIKDTKIDKEELLELLEEYKKFWKEHTGIELVFWIEQRDFTSIPTQPKANGDLLPTRKWRQDLTSDVHKRYGDYGTDNIVVMIHEDNFLFKGFWGINYSYSHFKYCLQFCRWDKDNSANSFGTLYHEQMHTPDAVIKEELGIDIAPQFGGDWDKYVTHGGRPGDEGKYEWKYIRYQENTDALKKIKIYLQMAYEARRRRHQQVIIKLLNSIIRLYKLINGKNK